MILWTLILGCASGSAGLCGLVMYGLHGYHAKPSRVVCKSEAVRLSYNRASVRERS